MKQRCLTLLALLPFAGCVDVAAPPRGDSPGPVASLSETGVEEWIIFESQRSGRPAVWRMRPDGTGLQMITADTVTAGEGTPSPSPDGSQIAFYRNNAGAWRMNADGTNRVLLAGNGGASTGMDWGPGGDEILYERFSPCSEDVWGVSPSGTRQRVVVDGGADIPEPVAHFPHRSVQRRITFIGTGCGFATGRLYSIKGNRTDLRLILDNAVFARWSPDGARLIVSRYDGSPGQYSLWVVNADGSNPVHLAGTTTDFGYPSWSPDGARIVFQVGLNIAIRNEDGSVHLVRTDGIGDRKPIWVRYE